MGASGVGSSQEGTDPKACPGSFLVGLYPVERKTLNQGLHVQHPTATRDTCSRDQGKRGFQSTEWRCVWGGLRSQGGVPLTGNPTGTLCVKALSGNIFGKISGAENKAKQWSRIGQNLVGAAQQLREQSPPDLLCTRMGTPP